MWALGFLGFTSIHLAFSTKSLSGLVLEVRVKTVGWCVVGGGGVGSGDRDTNASQGVRSFGCAIVF